MSEPLNPRGLRGWLHTLYEYIALYLGLGLLGVLCLFWLPFAMVLQPLLPKHSGGILGRFVIMLGFRLYLRGLNLMRACYFDLSALDALRHSGPVILAPNHPCLLDAVMVISRLPNVTCIMKASLMNNILLGAGARLAGYIRNDSLPVMVVNAVASLHQGNHLLIFPEGTRTTRLPVNEFVGSIGLIANRAQLPVQTIIIETDSAYLSKGWPLFRRPAMPIHYRVRLGQRFAPGGNAKSFTEQLETYFNQELRDKPPFPLPSATL